jgi:DNA-binding response OmpR family regulator
MKNVLVVDDEIDILDSIEAVLEIDGYKVSRCSDPLKAISSMKNLRPDLLILDVMMPLRTGPEILMEMKADPEIRHIPCILMSAGTNATYDQGVYKWDMYMKKPFDLDELLTNVKKLL